MHQPTAFGILMAQLVQCLKDMEATQEELVYRVLMSSLQLWPLSSCTHGGSSFLGL